MKTLKLLIKTSFFNKINDFMCFNIINKSLMEEATKCLFRTSLRSTHSTRMCFTVSTKISYLHHSMADTPPYLATYRTQLLPAVGGRCGQCAVSL